MARIREYQLDTNITTNDYLLGNDADNPSSVVTKRFSIEDLREFYLRGTFDVTDVPNRYIPTVNQTGDDIERSPLEVIHTNVTTPIALAVDGQVGGVQAFYAIDQNGNGTIRFENYDEEYYLPGFVGSTFTFMTTLGGTNTYTATVASYDGFVVNNEIINDTFSITGDLPIQANNEVIALTASQGVIREVNFESNLSVNGDLSIEGSSTFGVEGDDTTVTFNSAAQFNDSITIGDADPMDNPVDVDLYGTLHVRGNEGGITFGDPMPSVSLTTDGDNLTFGGEGNLQVDNETTFTQAVDVDCPGMGNALPDIEDFTIQAGAGTTQVTFFHADVCLEDTFTTGETAIVKYDIDNTTFTVGGISTEVNGTYSLVADTSALTFSTGFDPTGGTDPLSPQGEVYRLDQGDYYIWKSPVQGGFHISQTTTAEAWYFQAMPTMEVDFPTDVTQWNGVAAGTDAPTAGTEIATAAVTSMIMPIEQMVMGTFGEITRDTAVVTFDTAFAGTAPIKLNSTNRVGNTITTVDCGMISIQGADGERLIISDSGVRRVSATGEELPSPTVVNGNPDMVTGEIAAGVLTSIQIGTDANGNPIIYQLPSASSGVAEALPGLNEELEGTPANVTVTTGMFFYALEQGNEALFQAAVATQPTGVTIMPGSVTGVIASTPATERTAFANTFEVESTGGSGLRPMGQGLYWIPADTHVISVTVGDSDPGDELAAGRFFYPIPNGATLVGATLNGAAITATMDSATLIVIENTLIANAAATDPITITYTLATTLPAQGNPVLGTVYEVVSYSADSTVTTGDFPYGTFRFGLLGGGTLNISTRDIRFPSIPARTTETDLVYFDPADGSLAHAQLEVIGAATGALLTGPGLPADGLAGIVN